MNNDELVTLVVTAYNAEKTIHECLSSVEKQSYKNYEVHVINDGSSDKTEDVILPFTNKHKNWHYHYQTNAGVSVARNVGIKAAEGAYIAFIDGDDYVDPDYILKMKTPMDEDTDIVITCCHAFREESESVIEDRFFKESFTMSTNAEKEPLFMQLTNGNYGKPDGKGFTAVGVPWGKLYRVELFRKNSLLFDPELRRMQDNMFNMYAFTKARKIVYLDEAYYNYRLEHIQNRKTKYSKTIWMKMLKARHKFCVNNPDVISPQIKSGLLYEQNVALVASSLFVIENTDTKKEAIRQLKDIRETDIFRDSFNATKNTVPLKFQMIWYLYKLRLWNSLYFAFRLINHHKEA